MVKITGCPPEADPPSSADKLQATGCKLFKEAKKYLVGGVNSPVRAFKAVSSEPIFIKAAKGSKIYSEDNSEFIDYCLSYGALILGHSNSKVGKELKKAADKGTSFGAATRLETELAKIIIKAIPSIKKIRFTNSGTEAVMAAIRLSRAYTKKNKIVKFAGCYHGASDSLLKCPGIPKDFKKYILSVQYNDIKEVEVLVERDKDIAAIIVEPVAGNMGVVLPIGGFLNSLRELCNKKNIVLIFDEVITGFRLGFGGAQDIFKVKPDLTCLGKIVGGGLPIGAFGGKREIMQLLAPEGPVYQAGTFSGNPLTASAGIATLKILAKENPYAELAEETEVLCRGINSLALKYRIKIKINYIASMFSIFFAKGEVTDYNMAKGQDINLFRRFYHSLLKDGIYFSPAPFEANFLSCAHTTNDIEKTLKAIERAFREVMR